MVSTSKRRLPINEIHNRLAGFFGTFLCAKNKTVFKIRLDLSHQNGRKDLLYRLTDASVNMFWPWEVMLPGIPKKVNFNRRFALFSN